MNLKNIISFITLFFVLTKVAFAFEPFGYILQDILLLYLIILAITYIELLLIKKILKKVTFSFITYIGNFFSFVLALSFLIFFIKFSGIIINNGILILGLIVFFAYLIRFLFIYFDVRKETEKQIIKKIALFNFLSFVITYSICILTFGL